MTCIVSLGSGVPTAYAMDAGSFKFTAVSDTTVTIEVEGIAGTPYAICRSDPGSPTNFVAKHTLQASGTWTDSGLAPDTFYYYTVLAINVTNPTMLETRKVKTDATVPNVNLSVQGTTMDSITLQWESYPGAAQYRIYRSVDGGATFTAHDTTAASNTTFTDADLSGGRYHYQVKAIMPDGSEVDSNSVDAALAGRPFYPPTLTVMSYATVACLHPSWTNVEGATSYRLYRSLTKDGTYTYINTFTTNNYLDYNVAEGTVYWYYVEATDGVRVSTSSKVAGTTYTKPTPTPPKPTPKPTSTPPKPTAKPTPTPPKPTPTPTPAPSGPAAPDFWITAGSTTETTIKWSWRNIQSAHPAYKIYIADAENGPYKLLVSVNTGSSPKTGELYYSINQIPNNPHRLVDGQKYYIKMSAVDFYMKEGPMSSYSRYFYAFQPTQDKGFGSPPAYH